MRKVWLYLFSFACLTVYILSLNRPFMEWWADFRTYKLNAAYAKARYGDLYSICFLPGYTDTTFTPLKKFDETGNTDLYILHDSYLEGKIENNNFKGLNKLITVNYNTDGVNIVPDRSKKNILIIECSERSDWRFTDTTSIFAKMSLSYRNRIPQAYEGEPLTNYFFNPNINQNLEFSLYDYEYFIPVKELKAQINYSLFRRIPKDVSVSTDEKYLFLSETTVPWYEASSFCTVNEQRIQIVTALINQVTARYKRNGFDEVYFSLIPNPVSIVDANRMTYNHKIEMLEKAHGLEAKYISVYNTFRDTKEKIYRNDDSHWNGKGLQLWVDEVNRTIAE